MSTTTMIEGERGTWSPLSWMEMVVQLSPLFLNTDPTSEADLRKREELTRSFMKEELMKIGSSSSSPQYLPVKARQVAFEMLYPDGTILTFTIEHDPNYESIKTIMKDLKPVQIVVRGRMHAGCLVFNGRGGVSFGEKTETADDFKDYFEKALTGSIGRALVGVRIGTQYAGRLLDEGVPVDSPIPVIESTLTVNPTVNSATTPAPNPVPTTTARSATRMTSTQKPVGEKILLSSDDCRKGLVEVVTNIGPYAFKQLLSDRKNNLPYLPQDTSTWTVKQFNQALDYTNQWVEKPWSDWFAQVPSAAMKRELNAFQSTMSRNAVSGLATRLCDMEIANMTQGDMDRLIKQLREVDFEVALALQVDPAFAHLQRTFDVQHPLDLLHANRTEQQGTFAIYMAYVRDHVRPEQLPDTFKTQYQQKLAAFLAPATK